MPSAADASRVSCLAEDVQVAALHGAACQGRGDFRRRRALTRGRAAPSACPVPVVAGTAGRPGATVHSAPDPVSGRVVSSRSAALSALPGTTPP